MGKWIGIGLAIIGVFAIGYIVAMAIFPDLRVASRDIAIVILAAFQLITVILTIVLLLAILYAVIYIRRLTNNTIVPKVNELQLKLDSVIETTRSITGNVQDTTTTVSTTTTYMAERVVAPAIRVAGLAAGVRAAARFLARRGASSDLDNS